jgi:hypothetical protein
MITRSVRFRVWSKSIHGLCIMYIIAPRASQKQRQWLASDNRFQRPDGKIGGSRGES